MTLDDIDLRLVALLQANARLSYQQLGDAVGLSGAASYQRVKKLEGAGVITGYHARVEPTALARPGIVYLRARPGAATDMARLGGAWHGSPDVLECHRMAADGAYLLKLRLVDVAGVEPYLDAARAAGCAAAADVGVATVFERWALPVALPRKPT